MSGHTAVTAVTLAIRENGSKIAYPLTPPPAARPHSSRGQYLLRITLCSPRTDVKVRSPEELANVHQREAGKHKSRTRGVQPDHWTCPSCLHLESKVSRNSPAGTEYDTVLDRLAVTPRGGVESRARWDG